MTAPDTPAPHPGWYPDPAGSDDLRWWNGASWSPTTSPRWPAGEEPPPPPPPAGRSVGGQVAGAGRAPAGSGPRRLEIVTGVLAAVVFLTSFVTLGVRNSARDTGQSLGQVAADATVPDPLDRREVARAQAAAGCELLVDGEPLEDRTHVEPEAAPPPEVLYPQHRPAHSGRHFPRWLPLPDDVADTPIDERAVVHNLEHGSVAVWFDDAATDAGARQALASWKRTRDDLGFTSEVAGGIFVSPAPAIASGKAVALRAWGVAMDCDRFDPAVADAFLVDHWGSHGASPEAHLSPYPEGSLRYAEGT